MNSAPQYCNLIILVDLLLLGVLGTCYQFLRAAWFYGSMLLCFYASMLISSLLPLALWPLVHSLLLIPTSTSTHIAKMPVKTARHCWIPMHTIGKLVAGGGSRVIQEVTPPPSFNPSFNPSIFLTNSPIHTTKLPHTTTAKTTTTTIATITTSHPTRHRRLLGTTNSHNLK